MRVPLKWLAEYVDVADVDADELAERLTLTGLEVEAVETFGPVEGVVVGAVRAVEPHPAADHLTVCTVATTDGEHQVVCGAPNVAPGLCVPYALPGARLPGGVVERRDLRGVKSEGMLLSRAELGLESKSEGLWVLPEGAVLGADIAGLVEVPDVVFDLSITSNRPDLLGVYGVAREVAAVLGRTLREPKLTFAELGEPVADVLRVVIEEASECPRYVARLVRGIGMFPSPLWLQARLAKAGMRSLAPVVDVTNYVMLELGHPLHAFDHTRLGDPVIGVRRGRTGERLTTLDGVQRDLSPEVLLITAGERPVAVAGVMGGEDSEVDASTQDVVLEAACFAPVRIRRSARVLGLRTEASHRFERGISPEAADLASRRCCALLAEVTGAHIAPGAVDAYPLPSERRIVSLAKARVGDVLGVAIPEDQVRQALTSLGMKVQDTGDAWDVEVPPQRGDLGRGIDLIEEVARVYGYDAITAQAPRVPPTLGSKEPYEVFADLLRRTCAAVGLIEAITTSLTSVNETQVPLRNPMAQGGEGLRASLLPGLMTVVRHTLETQTPGAALFEMGHVFTVENGERVESEKLGIVLVGRPPQPLVGKRDYGPEHLKGVWERVLEALRVRGLTLGSSTHERLHPGRRATVMYDGHPVGWLGEVHPDLCADLPGRYRVQALEVDVRALMNAREAPAHRPLPRYPVSKRDLSLIGPANVPEGKLREAILSEALVEDCFLYDLYEGAQLGEGQRSLTYELTFRHPERTLASEEVDDAVTRILVLLAPMGMRLRS